MYIGYECSQVSLSEIILPCETVPYIFCQVDQKSVDFNSILQHMSSAATVNSMKNEQKTKIALVFDNVEATRKRTKKMSRRH